MVLPLDILLLCFAMGVLLLGYPVGLSLAGAALGFAALGWMLGQFDAALLIALPSRIFGIMTNSVLLAIPLFVLMGLILERSNIARKMLLAAEALAGQRPGGFTVAVIATGALMAASTGIVGASVVTLGLLALPSLLRAGVSPSLASGTIAASGTLGQIIPPSIVLIVLGDQMSNAYQKMQLDAGEFAPETVSVADLFAGAVIPGLALVALYMIYAAWAQRGAIAPDRPHREDTSLATHLAALLPPLILIIAVPGSILVGAAAPSEAAALGVAAAFLLAGINVLAENEPQADITQNQWCGRLCIIGLASLGTFFALRAYAGPLTDGLTLILGTALCVAVAVALATALFALHKADRLIPITTETAHLTSMIFLIIIGATVFSLVFRGLGGDDTVALLLNALPGGTYTALICVMLIIFFLGFFLEFLEITLVVIPLVVPVLLAMPLADGSAMSPVWLGILIALNLQTSFLTPPFGLSLFYLRSVAGDAVRTLDLYRGVIPFIALQLLVLVAVMAFPSLATALPNWLFAT